MQQWPTPTKYLELWLGCEPWLPEFLEPMNRANSAEANSWTSAVLTNSTVTAKPINNETCTRNGQF